MGGGCTKETAKAPERKISPVNYEVPEQSYYSESYTYYTESESDSGIDHKEFFKTCKDCNRKEALKELKSYVDAGGDVDVQDKRGKTGLMILCENSECYFSTKCIIYLLSVGANPNLQDKKGKTAMMYVLARAENMPPKKSQGVVGYATARNTLYRALITNGYDINIQDNNGYTAPMYSAYSFLPTFYYAPSDIENAVIDPFIKTNKGETLLDLAGKNPNVPVHCSMILDKYMDAYKKDAIDEFIEENRSNISTISRK